MDWYVAKTIWRITATGFPRNRDAEFHPDAELLEVRHVLIRARSLEAAISKARREADRYPRDSWNWLNPYGQRVSARRLPAMNSHRRRPRSTLLPDEHGAPAPGSRPLRSR